MLRFVDSVNRDRSVLNTWQMLDVRGFATTPYVANAYRGSSGYQFITDRVNGEATRNRLYPDRTTLVSRMAASPVLDGAAQTFLSPGKKMLVMCGSSTSASPTFVLFDAVLGVPEGDIDDVRRLLEPVEQLQRGEDPAGGRHRGAGEHLGVRRPHPGHLLLRAIGTLPAPVPGENAFVPGNFVFSPAQSEANQVETADKAYMAATQGGSTPGGGGGGSTGGGC